MGKVISVLAVILLLVYIGFQVSSNLSNGIETVDAVQVTVEDKTNCEGLFVRSAREVYGDPSKTYEFLVENGEKVAMGQEIAACFSSAEEAETFRENELLEKDILYAQQAMKNIRGEEGGAELDLSIFQNLKELSSLLQKHRVWDCGTVYSSLTQAVIVRDYPREDLSVLQEEIDEMQTRLDSYSASSHGQRLTAELPGYFLKAGETSATLCTVEELDSLTPDALRDIIGQEPAAVDSNVVGYILDNFEWYFAAVMSSEDAAVIAERGKAELSFPNMTSLRAEVRVDSTHYYDDEAIVIFVCGRMDESFLSGVKESVDVVKRSYTGIRLPKEALHEVDGQWGVYCLNGAMVKFKPVEWVYQGDSFYLCKQASSADKGLYLYDKIIVSGKNLKENMVVG